MEEKIKFKEYISKAEENEKVLRQLLKDKTK